MKRILFALLALAGVALAACRIYDVDVYRNVNGRARGADGVTESFTCTADSLLWAECFIGAANSPGGSYEYSVSPVGGLPIFEGSDTSLRQYSFSHAELHRVRSTPLIKGKEYVLKVTISNPTPNESLNYYYSDQNPYAYGMMSLPGNTQPLYWDLAARIEGIDRPTARDFFGMNGMECRWDSAVVDSHYALMDTLGIGIAREDIYWHWLESIPGSFRWNIFDPIAIAAAKHHVRLQVILQCCPSWASTHNQGAQGWDRDCPPRGLAEPVESAGSPNPNNYYAYYVYQVVNRYKPGGGFWTSHGLPDSAWVACYEVFNEPNYWRNPDTGYGYRVADTTQGLEYARQDSIAIVESLYARTADVACQAAHLADPNARLLVGSLGEVEWEHPTGELGPRLVMGKDWLRAYYRWRESTTTVGVSVHPYQHGDNDIAFNPEFGGHGACLKTRAHR